MDALQSALACTLAMLPRPVQDAASAVGGAAFDVAMAGVEAGLVPDAGIRRGIQGGFFYRSVFFFSCPCRARDPDPT